jgi:peptide/nickel transport system ATP-binding protein
LLGEVGLDVTVADRTALQLSGGQQQRVALGRALALNPEVLILDESLSALDLLTQQGVVKLILELQARHGFTCLFISHDLRLILKLAEQVLVMYRGEIVERGACSEILVKPEHAHTISLVTAVQQLQSACAAVTGQ